MENTITTEKRGIPGSTLKIIALVAMFIDHFAAIVIANYMLSGQMPITWKYMTVYYIYMVMRIIGRLGFPIFCFLLVEGAMHTRNIWLYLTNLALFAAISEIPFNLAFGNGVSDLNYQNVFFTLAIGLLAIIGIMYSMQKESWHIALKVLSYPAYVLTGFVTVYFVSKWMSPYNTNAATLLSDGRSYVIGGVVALIMIPLSLRHLDSDKRASIGYSLYASMIAVILAEALKTDYSGGGVLVILAMYLFRYRKPVIRGLVGCIVLTLMQAIEASAFLILVPLFFYNGKRGAHINKYFFYAFYPAHILILYLVCVAMHTV